MDRRLETSRAGHFAAGDVLGPPYGPFTHTARQLGRDAAENALGVDPHDANPDVGPWAIFTDPEFSMVGMTEQAGAGGRPRRRASAPPSSRAARRVPGARSAAW